MNINEIEENLKSLIEEYDKKEFIYELLLAYGLPKASITRLKKGSYDLSDKENIVSWKRRVLFKEEYKNDLHDTVSELSDNVTNDQRFIIVTDFKTLLARDTQTKENLDIRFSDLPKHYDFFLPWAGMEKTEYQNENPADVKAAERMAKFFDEIKKENEYENPEDVHHLNVFMSRLLFCFFAEDTNIFPDGVFTYSVASHTQSNASDLDNYLNKLFEVLNTPKKVRQNLPAYLEQFPYVNGGLFKEKISTPKFTRKSRQIIIESGELDWSEINPDIFGSMMQAVIIPGHRGDMGIHYTSVPNIMKVIRPLFLDNLYEEFETAIGNPKKLRELLHRLHKIKIFDPACGSGNFLIIAYKELRRLEMEILKSLGEMALSGITLDQFYGIEFDDFAHELAQLSLWLAEHQMNVEFFKEFGRANPTLPLKEAGQIICENACVIDWSKVCPNTGGEIYLLGNPPYKGFSQQSKQQKKDLKFILGKSTKLDYISCWFLLGAKYISKTNAKYCFVSTNSICQGEQVDLLWSGILNDQLEIDFAYQPFKWSNNAKQNAGVTCVIVGVRNKNSDSKFLFEEGHKRKVDHINPYLSTAQIITVKKRKKPLSSFPKMELGDMPNDYGGLQFKKEEMEAVIQEDPALEKYFRQVLGSREFLQDRQKYCLWLKKDDVSKISHIEEIKKRLELVKTKRAESPKKSYNKFANDPYRFIEIRNQDVPTLIIPGTSSENRVYLPIGFVEPDVIVNNLAFAVYDPPIELFGILHSKMHYLWLVAVGGSLETRIRYSSVLCYNTFPFPKISDNRKKEIHQCVFRIIEEREKYPDIAIGDLYDPDVMPTSLLEAHLANDEVIEKCYRGRPFESDEERLEYLFKLYEKMIEGEQQKNTLFENKKGKK